MKEVSRTLDQIRRAQPFLDRLSDEGGAFRRELLPDTLALLRRLQWIIAVDIHRHSALNAAASRRNIHGHSLELSKRPDVFMNIQFIQRMLDQFNRQQKFMQSTRQPDKRMRMPQHLKIECNE